MSRNSLWKSMLTADMNVRYWKHMVLRYQHRDLCVKIALALASSASVASWIIWEYIPVLWKALSMVATIISIITPFLSYPKLLEEMTEVRYSWARQLHEYEQLWDLGETNGFNDGIMENYGYCKQREVDITKSETHLPDDEKLLATCQQAVLKSRIPKLK